MSMTKTELEAIAIPAIPADAPVPIAIYERNGTIDIWCISEDVPAKNLVGREYQCCKKDDKCADGVQSEHHPAVDGPI